MIEANGGGGELRAVIQITRASTGKVEEYEITGYATDEQIEQLKEQTWQPTAQQPATQPPTL